jgi:hypothetical protein
MQRELAGRAAGRLDRGRVEPIELGAKPRELLIEGRRTEQAAAARRDANGMDAWMRNSSGGGGPSR